MLAKEIGNKVLELRNELNLSQLELSKKSGIERGQISKIEKGNVNITIDTLEKLAKALTVPTYELLKFDEHLKPFVKWAGGKTQLIKKLLSYAPKHFNTYYEPFVGGGALFFALAPKNAVINDINQELMCVYKCLKDTKKYNKLISLLNEHEKNHNEDYFLKIRNMDRDPNYSNLDDSIRAARMIYLNKSCFNGLYRVNSKGLFNVPSGKKIKVNTFDRENFDKLKNYFKSNDIKLLSTTFENAVKTAKNGDFVYFDPPYDDIEEKKVFNSYDTSSFNWDMQVKLANCFKELDKKGVLVMLSNHNTKRINELYKDFNIKVVNAKRMINSKGTGRGDVQEVIITNYNFE